MSIGSDKTLQGLFQFVKDQPPEKHINNICFRTCAIGKYLGEEPAMQVYRSSILDWAYNTIPQDPQLRCGFCMYISSREEQKVYAEARPPETYGELQQIIKDYETRTRYTNTGELGSSRGRVQEDTVPSVQGERREIAEAH